MELNDPTLKDRPMSSVKHPLIAFGLASGRILLFPIKHGFKPARIDYRTGDVWPDNEPAVR